MAENDGFETYTRHICVEHQRLNRLLLETRHRIDAWRATGGRLTPADVIAELHAVRAELQHHFAEEEEEGCLEEAMCRYPALAPQANQLLQEHRGILADMDRLCASAQQGAEQGLEVGDFVIEFQRIYDLLQDHEARESRVVQQAFSASLDTENEPAVD